MLQSVPWSVGRSFSDVTSARLGSPIQPIRRNQQHRSAFLNISSQAESCEASECRRTVPGLVITLRGGNLKLREASGRVREVVLSKNRLNDGTLWLQLSHSGNDRQQYKTTYRFCSRKSRIVNAKCTFAAENTNWQL